jgi:hypothetical protein
MRLAEPVFFLLDFLIRLCVAPAFAVVRSWFVCIVSAARYNYGVAGVWRSAHHLNGSPLI